MRAPRPEIFTGFIQSSFGSDHGNFEAVIKLANNELWHYWRDNTATGNQTWSAGLRICQNAAYTGSLIQSHYKGRPHVAGDFEVIVPVTSGNNVQMVHFWRSNANSPNTAWQQGGTVTPPSDQVLGPGCIIQSSFGPGGNFEAVVPISSPEGPVLWHYWRENPPDPQPPFPQWQRALQVSAPGDVVIGPGCLIESTRNNGSIEVVVPVITPDGRKVLRHITRVGDRGEWTTNPTPITGADDEVAGGAVIIESDFRDSSGQGNFEVLVGLRKPQHIEIRHFWHDTSNSPNWTKGQRVLASAGDSTDSFATAGLALIQSDYPDGGDHHDFEALVMQCTQSIGNYLRFNDATPQPQWAFGGTKQIVDFDSFVDEVNPTGNLGRLPEEPHINHYTGVGKICQLIGEYDLEGWTSRAVPASNAAGGPAITVLVPDATAVTPTAVIAAWANAGDGRLTLSASTLEYTQQPDSTPNYYTPAPQTSDFTDAAPALAARAGSVFMAWKGRGNTQLNIASLQYTPSGWGSPAIGSRLGIVAPVTPATDAGPALTMHRGQLILAWKGVGNGFLNIAFWQSGTPAFTNALVFNEVTIAAPALVSHNDRLLIAWTGTDHSVNIAELPTGSATLTAKNTLPEKSLAGPALVSWQNRLFLAVSEAALLDGVTVSTGKTVILASDDGGINFHGRPRTPQTTTASTSLAAGLDRMFWAWTQEPNHQVNVGRYVPPPGPQPGTTRPPATPFGSAFNQTESRAGIQGTDLGNQFMHNDRMCFLFGDTAHPGDQPIKDDPDTKFNLDTIAFAAVTDFDAGAGLKLTFNPAPPVINGVALASQRTYSVPLDGITINDAMYVFYSLDSVQLSPGESPYQSFGHTDVVKSTDDGATFTHLHQFSNANFLNVSIAKVSGAELGMNDWGDTLAVWGSGIYHSSEVYLAALQLSTIDTGAPIRYFTGLQDGRPVWVENSNHDEDAAVPLFADPTVAELSVRYNLFLSAWVMTYTSRVVYGVCLRLSTTPWGPWTLPVRLQHQWYTPTGAAVTNKPWSYTHTPNNVPGLIRQDWMYDQSMLVPGDPANTSGIIYSPAVIEPLTQGTVRGGHSTTIFYTMSTWSPYTSLLMRADLDVADLPPLDWRSTNPGATLTGAQLMAALNALNIGTSLNVDDVTDWLGDATYTEYPAIAQAVLALLAGRRLPPHGADIDVIVGYYEKPDQLKQPKPHTLTDINTYALAFAVLSAVNDKLPVKLSEFRELFM